MAVNDAMKPIGLLASLALIPLAVNQLAFVVLGYPALYCLFGPMFSSLYMQWGLVILYAVSAYTAFQLFRRQTYPALGGVVVIIGIIELPNLAEHAFRLGGTCG